MELKEHQLDAIKRLDNGKILWGGVGTGKSMTAMAYYMEREAPKDIYIITTAKKRDSLDWNKEAARFGIGRTKDSTVAGVLTVDSWNNIGRYVDVEDAFFIFDEQRVVGSGAWVKNFIKIAKKNRWILLSATPGDTWLDYIPVFIANGLYKNATEFKREHVVYAPYSRYPKVVRYIQISTLEKYRNMLLVEMPYEKHTIRIMNDIPVEYDIEAFKKAVTDRWHPYEDRPIKDVGELFFVMRRIANSDPSRLDAIRKLLVKHPKMIIFYNFNYELDLLRTLGGDGVAVAEWNGHKKQPIPVEQDSWVYLVQYVAGAEGWNCIETDTMVFWSMTYSYKNFAQSQGRIDRMNTPFTNLYYYIMKSKAPIDQAVSGSLSSKKMFNERAWAHDHGLDLGFE